MIFARKILMTTAQMETRVRCIRIMSVWTNTQPKYSIVSKFFALNKQRETWQRKKTSYYTVYTYRYVRMLFITFSLFRLPEFFFAVDVARILLFCIFVSFNFSGKVFGLCMCACVSLSLSLNVYHKFSPNRSAVYWEFFWLSLFIVFALFFVDQMVLVLM